MSNLSCFSDSLAKMVSRYNVVAEKLRTKEKKIQTRIHIHDYNIFTVFIYLRSFYSKILKVDHMLRFITKTVNYIRGCALNHLEFIQLLEDVYNKFSDISVYTEIRWLFYHKVL